MIIDAILDRKLGEPYNAKVFYDYVTAEEEIFFPKMEISRAMDCGTNTDVQKALCDYITRNDYNPAICDYINTVSWIDPEDDARRSAVYNALDAIKEDIINDCMLSIDEILALENI